MDEIGEKYRASIEKASLEDLLGVLGQIDREKFPNRIEFVQREIERRKASGDGVPISKKSARKRLLIVGSVILVVSAYIVAVFIASRPSNEEIENLRILLSSSEDLKSQLGEFEVLSDKPQIGEISVSLIGHPAEGTLSFKIRTKDQEGYISVDWKRKGDGLIVTGVHN